MKRRNCIPTASSIILAAVIAIGVSAPGAAARGRSKPTRPDLVIQHVQFRSTPSKSASSKISSVVVEKDGSAPFGLVFTVKNRGHAPALLSHVKVLLGHRTLRDEIVGAIAPGRSKMVERSYTARLTGMGFYNLSICAVPAATSRSRTSRTTAAQRSTSLPFHGYGTCPRSRLDFTAPVTAMPRSSPRG